MNEGDIFIDGWDGIPEINRKEDIMKKGKLVRVKLPNRGYVKMHEVDAAAAGYIKLPQKKMKPAQENKMAAPSEVKTKPLPQVEPDDFTTIDGVGKATDRILKFNNIVTLEQLKTADLDFLSATARAAIERWRDE